MPSGAAPTVFDQLRPLRGPIEMDAAPLLPPVVVLVVVLLSALAVGLLILHLLRPTETRAPAAIAERELLRLLGLRLPEQGRVKEHYALLGACLRRYVAEVYRLPAPALTATELATALAPRPVDPGFADYLHRVLGTADLVRFDHTSKTGEEARADVVAALDAIRAASSPALPSAA